MNKLLKHIADLDNLEQKLNQLGNFIMKKMKTTWKILDINKIELMNEIKDYFNQRLNHIKADLSNPHSDTSALVTQKNQLLDMLYLIEMYEKYDLSRKNIEKILVLPVPSADFSDFRIIEDMETDEQTAWQEVKIDNDIIRLDTNDLIIKKH